MRMNMETFDYILEAIRSKIEKHSNFRKCISPEERLMVTLRYLSTGLAFRSMAFSFRMGDCTIAKIVYEACEAIWETLKEIHMPVPSTDDLYRISLEYEQQWGFPNCVGSIDGKHVRIKCPSKYGSMFFNYKKFFWVHLQGIADANSKFLTVDNNTLHMPPSRVLANTVTLPYVLIGYQGYPLKEYLLRPYAITDDGEDNGKQIFNYRLSRARRCIECAFGILVSKWRCLKCELQGKHRQPRTCADRLHYGGVQWLGTGTGELGKKFQSRNTQGI
ncbi:uncharacterized protein LOC143220086 [Lasioglossum baleicum]|uniref:uncharacterized protein LOC143220086 n=1 Tax=Lasioglossum baleicum TaxID=434251 RepID=UPI003FCEDF6B